MSVAWISSLRRWVSVAAAVSLAVTAAALFVALSAAAGTQADGRVLSHRLVPAAAASGRLLAQYTAQQTALRDYVTSGRQADLRPFARAASQIPQAEAAVAGLVRGYPGMPALLAAAAAAHRAWLARVAGPQLRAAGQGNFAGARALQANIPFTRPYTLAVRTPVTALQTRITSLQGAATAHLIGGQRRLLAALLAICAVVAMIAVGSVLAVRRWLLEPFTALREAAESVAAGRFGTRVPAVGPPELAELGRSTERMRTCLVAALADAAQAEVRFRWLFEASPNATLAVAADGSIVMINEQAKRMFGYTAGELAGRPVELLVPAAARGAHPGKREGYLADPMTRPMGQGQQLYALRKNREEFPVEISLSSLPGESGVVAVVRDVSEQLAAQAERERFERQMQQSERMDSLGQLVGGVAHDFNNLLNVISGYVGFIAEQVTSLAAEDQRMESVLADVEQVRAAADRAASLTRQLLIFARRDVVRPAVLDVNAVIRGVEQLLRRTLGEHVDLIITPGAGLWPVKADPGQLEQILVNLAVNARDAMPGGGKLSIDSDKLVVDETYAATRPDLQPGRFVRLRVSDTGTGMTSQVLAQVFEPFYSTKREGRGTGLGLATVYGIITRAGGYAQIYSEPGLGTTVTALLPATDAAVWPAEPVPPAPARGRGETVLLVEDELTRRDKPRR